MGSGVRSPADPASTGLLSDGPALARTVLGCSWTYPGRLSTDCLAGRGANALVVAIGVAVFSWVVSGSVYPFLLGRTVPFPPSSVHARSVLRTPDSISSPCTTRQRFVIGSFALSDRSLGPSSCFHPRVYFPNTFVVRRCVGPIRPLFFHRSSCSCSVSFPSRPLDRRVPTMFFFFLSRSFVSP